MNKKWLSVSLFSAAISAFLFISNVYSNLIADYIRDYLEPYRTWVWVGFGAGIILAFAAGYIAVRQSQQPTEDHSISIGGNVDGSPIIQESHVEGDLTIGDKITNIYQPPPSQTSATSLHQLPPPPKDFTGRKDELDDLLEKVNQGSIAISGLQGTGGVGKTALALVLAERLTPSYPDAQIYLDLKGVSKQPVTPSDAMIRIIHAWNPTANPPEEELEGLYRSVLNGKRALLLFDNAADAEQVLSLLPPDGCLALVTSRQRFDLPGCYTRCLDMLTPEDARKLVLEIAPRVGKQADELVKLCGYLPLALRNAAGTLNHSHLSVEDYMERLSHAKERLSLINATLSMSYDLLSDEQQTHWRMLGVFPGSFDAKAAAAVWELELNQAQNRLDEFLVRSMVESETKGRCKLHDLSRVYANEKLKLNKAERAAAQRRHAEHYADVACAADDIYEKGGESVLAGLGLFDLERENIEAGQRWASQHEQHNDDQAAKMCLGYAMGCINVLTLRLHPQERIQWLNSALRVARRLKNRRGEGAALGNLGSAYKMLGNYRRAIEFHEQDLAIVREIGDRRGEARSLGNLGIAYDSLGDYRRAIEFHEQNKAIAREIGDRQGEARSLGNLGNAYLSLGEHRRAIEFYEQNNAIAREIGDRHGEAQSLGNLSNAYLSLDDYRRVIEYCEQSLVIKREISDRRGEGSSLGILGSAYYYLGDYRRAIEFHEQSFAIAREISNRQGEANSLFNISLVMNQLGERAQAIPNAQAALDILEQIESPAADIVRQALAEWQA